MEPSDTASRTQEALRIQVSAVAAQQTKLLEDEFRMEGRQLALQRAGVELRGAEANRRTFEEAAEAGLANADYGALIPYLRDRAS